MRKEKKKEKEKELREGGRFRIIWHYVWKPLLVLVILAGVLWYLNYEFHIDKVNVTGVSFYTEEEIEEKVIRNILDENALYLFLKYKYFKGTSIPFVEKIDVEFVNHHEVLLSVYEKSMIACIPYMSEYLYFDKDGTIIESSPERMEEIPVVDGVKFNTMSLYEKLAVEDDSIFETILSIVQLIKRYEIDVDKVYFNYKNEVILYCGEIRVLLGNSKLYDDKIAEASNIIKKAKNKNLQGSLDMRNYQAGDKNIVFKEEHFDEE